MIKIEDGFEAPVKKKYYEMWQEKKSQQLARDRDDSAGSSNVDSKFEVVT